MNSTRVKFLIVDDTEENLVALEALLRRDGLELLRARSGAEALELLLVHEVALALLDVQMPEMDGFELAELMRGTERTKNVPIIFLTAGPRDPQRVFKGYESGAVDFLFKPLEPHVLKSKAEVFFELERQRVATANALRLNEMFMGILGHDLRNPLSAIITGAQILGEQLSEESHRRTLGRMKSAGQRMTDMVDQLLDLTRVRVGNGLDLVRASEPFDVAELARRTIDELGSSYPDRLLTLETSGTTCSLGDSDRLLQLLSNLVGNALHHGDPTAPVTVRIAGTDRELVVEIENGGVIPPELQPSLFDPFRSRQRSARSVGLGLGLFIAQQIALGHGGSIEVESSAASGKTLFRVLLPRR